MSFFRFFLGQTGNEVGGLRIKDDIASVPRDLDVFNPGFVRGFTAGAVCAAHELDFAGMQILNVCLDGPDGPLFAEVGGVALKSDVASVV